MHAKRYATKPITQDWTVTPPVLPFGDLSGRGLTRERQPKEVEAEVVKRGRICRSCHEPLQPGELIYESQLYRRHRTCWRKPEAKPPQTDEGFCVSCGLRHARDETCVPAKRKKWPEQPIKRSFPLPDDEYPYYEYEDIP